MFTLSEPAFCAGPKSLFAHIMVSFGTPEHNGGWKGWNYSNQVVTHDPDFIEISGNRDIASAYYPVIGPYDMTDPDLVEYHCQLMKMSGIDGAMFDLGFFDDFSVRSMKLYVEYLKLYGLKAVLIFEDKARFIWDNSLETRDDTVKAALKDLDSWLALFKDVQFKVGNRLVLGLFSYDTQVPGRGPSRLLPEELEAWKETYSLVDRPIIVRQWYDSSYKGVVDGQFDWPLISGGRSEALDAVSYNDFNVESKLWSKPEKTAAKRLEEYQFPIGGVWPGFDDKGCWGWGGGRRGIDRVDGRIYEYHWDRAIKEDFSIVQIATWNDWFEGSNVEPSLEFGYKYLEMTREYASEWKDAKIPTGNLRLPEWIYKARKSTEGKKVLETVSKASALIREGKYAQAEELMQPLAK